MKQHGEYYYLDKGDIMQKGDEWEDVEHVFRGPSTWKPVREELWGQPASDPCYLAHSQVRRKITSANAQSCGTGASPLPPADG